MAGSHSCAALFFLSPLLRPPFSGTRMISLRPVLCRSSVLPPFPSKSRKRKNHLRPKILKTLRPKPSSEEPPINTVVPIDTTESLPPHDEVLEPISVPTETDVEFQVSEGSAIPGTPAGISGKLSSKDFVKYGLYILGLFAFQTVCAVWIMGSAKPVKKEGNSDSNSSTMNINDKDSSQKKTLLDGYSNLLSGNTGLNQSNVINLDELELNEKIEEIRQMAREVRRIEQGNKNKHEEDGILGSSNDKINIEKEIEGRLANMEKRLNSQRKGLAGLHMKHLDEFKGGEEDEMGNLNVEQNDIRNVMFKRKRKFKREKPPNNVKGFPGRENGRVATERGNGEGLSKFEETKNGILETNENLNLSSENDKDSGNLQKEGKTIHLQVNSGKDVNRKQDLAGKTSAIRNGKVKQAGRDVWWLKLPYVLRILMRSSLDGERSEGFFTVRTNSETPNLEESSYVVAFEDHGDARNFSYILESYFEDLDDFRADIVPVSTEDLYEEVKSGGKKVIVLKKRQIKLYAGQPLEDLERTLRSLILEESSR